MSKTKTASGIKRRKLSHTQIMTVAEALKRFAASPANGRLSNAALTDRLQTDLGFPISPGSVAKIIHDGKIPVRTIGRGGNGGGPASGAQPTVGLAARVIRLEQLVSILYERLAEPMPEI